MAEGRKNLPPEPLPPGSLAAKAPSAELFSPESLPPELEARIAALESAASDQDFDAASWIWMALFGIALPVALMLLGG